LDLAYDGETEDGGLNEMSNRLKLYPLKVALKQERNSTPWEDEGI
jgi:hypothetical protein